MTAAAQHGPSVRCDACGAAAIVVDVRPTIAAASEVVLLCRRHAMTRGYWCHIKHWAVELPGYARPGRADLLAHGPKGRHAVELVEERLAGAVPPEILIRTDSRLFDPDQIGRAA